MGRKSAYTPELAAEIIADLTKGIPLAEICRRDHMPESRSVYRWIEDFPQFASEFARARHDGFDAIAADCLRIADEEAKDIIDDGSGRKVTNSAAAVRARLRIETRLKLLAKWDPNRYGDRIEVEHAVNSKTLSRADALAALQSGSIDVNALLTSWTKPVEAIEAEIEPKTPKTTQAASGDDFVDID
jgi:hypothetical protein